MTKTAEQLYWDRDFVEKRIKEQKEHIDYIYNEYGFIQIEWDWSETRQLEKRGQELFASANKVLKRLERQLENIKKLNEKRRR